jgi:tetratricopeptide (TPR) repeat protein
LSNRPAFSVRKESVSDLLQREMPELDAEEAAPVTLESRQRFSQSRLWQWQAEYFEKSGATAWAGSVPFYATSSVHIARCYSQIIARYIQDLAKMPETDPQKPVYIVELGAGSGQFSYYCLKHLTELCDTLQLPLKFCWVMTDFTQANIDFWKQQQVFQPFIEAGALDMALFNVDAPGPLELQHGRHVISPQDPGSALVAIANYVFDSTRHDVFHIENGLLHEALVTLHAPESALEDGEPSDLSLVDYTFETASLDNKAALYDNPLWNEVLSQYRNEPDLRGSFIFPTAMLSALDYLEKLGGGKLMLQASDKGYLDIEDIEGRQPPSLALHNGCFSLTVNFDAVQRFTRLKGGRSFHQIPDSALRSCVYIYDGMDSGRYPETAIAVRDYMQAPGPGDFFRIYRFYRDAENFDLAAFIGFLHASFWDPHIITAKSDVFFKSLADADENLRRAVQRGLGRAEQMIYERPGMKDHYFSLATLYFGLKDYANAARLYAMSNNWSGQTFATCFNIGLCYHLDNQQDKAITAFTEASLLETDGSQASDWLERLTATN